MDVGVGSRATASELLDKALSNLQITSNKEEWFKKFVAIFSVEAAYKELADRMMETYQSGENNDITEYVYRL